MRYPAMSKQQRMSVNVPTLDGGVNYTDMPYAVQDNQLTECKNMWWHNGALRTRPGVEKAELQFKMGSTGFPVETASRIFRHNGSQRLSEQELAMTYIGEKEGKMVFYADSFQDNREEPWEVLGFEELETERDTDVLLARKGNNYYAYMSNGNTLETSGYFEKWYAAEPYVPLIIMNGKGDADESGAPATTYEGYNRLTGAFRCQYSTDGKSSSFQLPQRDLTYNEGENITVTVTLQKDAELKTLEFELKPSTSGVASAAITGVESAWLGLETAYSGTGTVVCTVDYELGQFYFTATFGEGNAAKTEQVRFPKPAGLETNNLEIKAWKTDPDKQAVIGKMTQSTWFGGDRSGVAGGTRLFVTGNPDDPNLVCWSDLNEPLYFPDNNCAYVGDATQAVTGFGKQEDKLVIFKEHEIYYAQYVAGNVTDAADITAHAAYFPLTPVHSTIGCDCPNTIRLVNNKLVWLCSNGHVYTLPTVSQYSETNVRDISLLIQRELQTRSKDDLKAAVAGEYMGYYLLAVHNRIYMMNAECSAFASVHYYSSKERAQRAIPWYVWDVSGVDTRILGMTVQGEQLCIAQESESIITLGGTTDAGSPIPCSFTTKAFDFGSMDKRKAITQLYLGATAASPLKMRLSYITDRFTAEDAAILEGEGDSEKMTDITDRFTAEDAALQDGEGDPEKMTAETYKTYRVTPNVHRVSVFGLRVDCDGAMAVTRLTIKYKNEGVTR